MSPRIQSKTAARRHKYAELFAALGDETRLTLVAKLSGGEPKSISQLADGSDLTRQAITKHLRVLENVGLVHATRSGRESHFELDTTPFKDMEDYLAFVSEQWDRALLRLKAFVEE